MNTEYLIVIHLFFAIAWGCSNDEEDDSAKNNTSQGDTVAIDGVDSGTSIDIQTKDSTDSRQVEDSDEDSNGPTESGGDTENDKDTSESDVDTKTELETEPETDTEPSPWDAGSDTETALGPDTDIDTETDTGLPTQANPALVLQPSTGVYWVRCPIGQEWNAASQSCTGTPIKMTWCEVTGGCSNDPWDYNICEDVYGPQFEIAKFNDVWIVLGGLLCLRSDYDYHQVIYNCSPCSINPACLSLLGANGDPFWVYDFDTGGGQYVVFINKGYVTPEREYLQGKYAVRCVKK